MLGFQIYKQEKIYRETILFLLFTHKALIIKHSQCPVNNVNKVNNDFYKFYKHFFLFLFFTYLVLFSIYIIFKNDKYFVGKDLEFLLFTLFTDI